MSAKGKCKRNVGERKKSCIQVRLFPGVMDWCRMNANIEGRSVSSFIRRVVETAAAEEGVGARWAAPEARAPVPVGEDAEGEEGFDASWD